MQGELAAQLHFVRSADVALTDEGSGMRQEKSQDSRELYYEIDTFLLN